MNVNFTPEPEALVSARWSPASTTSEVVREAMRLLEDQDRLAKPTSGRSEVLAESLVQADRSRLQDGREGVADVQPPCDGASNPTRSGGSHGREEAK